MSRQDRHPPSGSRSADLPGAVPKGPGLRHDRDPGRSPDIADAGVISPEVSASAMGGTAGDGGAPRAPAEPGAPHTARFALPKFRPTTLPTTLLTRSALLGRLEAGASQRLTVVVGSAGAGKSVLLSSWAATRDRGATSWLSCDEADADPVRFWTGFIQAPRAVAPGFGADAAELLAMDGVMSADVTASIANDAARLPAGSDRKSTRLNSSHLARSRMPSSA